MTNSISANELLWEEQQCANRERASVERRAWLKSFVLVLVLIVLTLGVATGFAVFGAGARAF